MKPGDDFPAFVDPLTRRGEALKDIPEAQRTPEQRAELASLQELARARLHHTAQFPAWLPSAEESEFYLKEQEAKSASERESWLRTAWEKLWDLLAPLVLQFGQAAIGAALAKVPHDVLIPGLVRLDLVPVLNAVETIANDGLGEVVKP